MRRRCRSWTGARCPRVVPAGSLPQVGSHGGARAEPVRVVGRQAARQAPLAVQALPMRRPGRGSSREELHPGTRGEAGGRADHRRLRRDRAGRDRGAALAAVRHTGHRDRCRHTGRRHSADPGHTGNHSRRGTAPVRRNRGWHSRNCSRSPAGRRWGSRRHGRTRTRIRIRNLDRSPDRPARSALHRVV